MNDPWGQVLQEPWVNIDRDSADRRRSLWMQRQATMSQAQQSEMDQLTAALKAQRDKQLADLAAADALRARGSGGGGGRHSSGTTATLTTPPPVDDTSSWLDAYLASLPTSEAPSWEQPSASDLYGAANLYQSHTPTTYSTRIAPGQKGYRPDPYTTQIARGQKGYHPAPAPKGYPLTNPKVIAPTKYTSRLS